MSIGPSVDLSRYKPETMMAVDTTVVVLGQRGSGKTELIRYILSCIKDKMDFCVSFCPSRDTRLQYEECMPRCFCYPEFSEKDLARICDSQLDLAKRAPVRRSDGTQEKPLMRRIGIVLDDCMFDAKALKNPTMSYLMMNGRHENFFLINGIQYIMDFPKNLRSQIGVSIVFPEPNRKMRDSIREQLLGCFDTDEQLQQVFQQLKPHEALVFDQNARRAGRPFLYFIGAPWPIPRFMVGSERFWKMYYRHMKPVTYTHVDQKIRNKVANILAAAAAKTGDAADGTSGSGGAGAGAAGGGSGDGTATAIACAGGPCTFVRVEDGGPTPSLSSSPKASKPKRKTPTGRKRAPAPPVVKPLAPLPPPPAMFRMH